MFSVDILLSSSLQNLKSDYVINLGLLLIYLASILSLILLLFTYRSCY